MKIMTTYLAVAWWVKNYINLLGVVEGVGGCPVLGPLAALSSFNFSMLSATWSGVKELDKPGEGEKGEGAGVTGKLVQSA